MRPVLLIFVITILFSCSADQKEKPLSSSWQLMGFQKADSINPILQPSEELKFQDPYSLDTVQWEERNVLNPAAVVYDDKVYMLYRAQDSAMTSRIGLAVSEDGLHFRKESAPIFYPEPGDSLEWPGGVEDPRIVSTEDGKFLLTYTAYDGRTARLCIASSSDLRNWVRHGPVLKGSEYRDYWSKSGAIISRESDGKIIATPINGKYWMYFGDTDLFMASSEDGMNWEPVLNSENGQLVSVMHPRPGFFDSRLVEPGPYALLRDEGILLIYNASNASSHADPGLPQFTYAAGQALFDKAAPWKLIDRSDKYFIHPEKDYELRGEVNQVCFVEGLVRFREKWFLYYGTADSRIAVAVSGER